MSIIHRLVIQDRQISLSFFFFFWCNKDSCKIFPQYLETVIFISLFPLQSKLQHSVFYYSSKGTSFKVLILCHLKLINSFLCSWRNFSFWQTASWMSPFFLLKNKGLRFGNTAKLPFTVEYVDRWHSICDVLRSRSVFLLWPEVGAKFFPS